MLNMHLILRLKQMHILTTIRRKVANSPRSQNTMLISSLPIVIITRGHDKTSLGMLHLGTRQIGRVEGRALNVDDALRPEWYLQDHGEVLVEFARREKHHIEVL